MMSQWRRFQVIPGGVIDSSIDSVCPGFLLAVLHSEVVGGTGQIVLLLSIQAVVAAYPQCCNDVEAGGSLTFEGPVLGVEKRQLACSSMPGG
jgi:hypothetical protein